MNFSFEEYGNAFLAVHLHRLRELVSAQCDKLYKDGGSKIPSHCTSLLLILPGNSNLSVMQLAAHLDYSHQLINQRVGILENLNLIERLPDSDDKRRKIIRLTPAGKREARKVRKLLEDIRYAIDQLVTELDVDLLPKLQQAEHALQSNPIYLRSATRQ